MNNVQVIDGANNATLSLFQATYDKFAAIFVGGCNMELVEDLFDRIGADAANPLLGAIWSRPILKRNALGLHGTLFYDNGSRQIPAPKRKMDWDDGPSTRHNARYFRGTTNDCFLPNLRRQRDVNEWRLSGPAIDRAND